MDGTLLIRPSRDADVPHVAAIYEHWVLHGTASFETAPPDPEEMAKRRADLLRLGMPYLIGELEGKVVGYAYAGLYRTRAAYRFSVENSIYVHPRHTGKGIGRLLLAALIRACEQGPWRQMIAVIGDSENTSSIRLHEAFGFRHAGVLHSVGFKFGRWLDTVLMQRALGSGSQTPPQAL